MSGLDELKEHLQGYSIVEDEVLYLEKRFPKWNKMYFDELRNAKNLISQVSIKSKECLSIIMSEDKTENDLIFITGQAHILYLILFSIKHYLSFASLVSTYATRMRITAGNDKILFEFGLRRAQGPLGSLQASKCSYITTFDGVSNVLCGKMTGAPLNGTCAHSFIMSYQGRTTFDNERLSKMNKDDADFVVKLFTKAKEIREKLGYNTNLSELLAFTVFSSIYKNNSILLCDTYNVLESGIPNTIIIALAMNHFGFQIKGIRLDSGDMVKQSIIAKQRFKEASLTNEIPWINEIKVGASNDINENTLLNFNERNHEIDIFGIGTNLVTCQSQPFIKLNHRLITVTDLKTIDTISFKELSLESNVVNIKERKTKFNVFLNQILTKLK